MKKIIVALIFFMAMGLLSSCKIEDETPIETPIDFNLEIEQVNKFTFINQDLDMMPIGVWSDPPPANFGGIYDNLDLITDQQYQWIKESGVNAVYGLYNNVVLNIDGVIRSLEHAGNHGITYLVRDSQVTGSYDDEDYHRLTATLDLYKNYSAFGGTMVTDEPGVISYDNLANLHKNYKTYLPDKAFYINMLPTYASKNQLVNGAAGGSINDDSITYERYMEEYLQTVQPKFYSYDFYPFTGMTYGNMSTGYFSQMAIVRDLTNEYEIPFWTFIQACTWNVNGQRVPNQTEIYWQVATSLAFGAKGIQYFLYYTPMEGGGSFSGGMVDVNGNKTPMYTYVQNANMHILSIDHILMNSVHQGVMVNGDSPDLIPTNQILNKFSILNDVSGDDTLVGCFNYQGMPAYYVVNNSLFNETGTHTLSFDDEVLVRIYEGTSTREVRTSELTLSIGAGQGVLVEVIE